MTQEAGQLEAALADCREGLEGVEELLQEQPDDAEALKVHHATAAACGVLPLLAMRWHGSWKIMVLPQMGNFPKRAAVLSVARAGQSRAAGDTRDAAGSSGRSSGQCCSIAGQTSERRRRVHRASAATRSSVSSPF